MKIKQGFRIRQLISGNWGIYFKRKKIADAGSEQDALEWIEEHDENGNRTVPLEPLAMTVFDWQK